MAKNVKKIPFPDWLMKIDYKAELEDTGITEDGEPKSKTIIKGKCIFSEKTKKVVEADGTKVILIGKVILKGDAAPNINKIKSGKVYIGEKVLDIYSCSRPRNPDGSIYSTNLEVM